MFGRRKILKKLDKNEEKIWQDNIKNEKLSFKDVFAMISSAFLTLFLPALLVLLALSLFVLWLFGAI